MAPPSAPGRFAPHTVRLVIAAAVLVALAAAACTRWPAPTAIAERLLGDRMQRSVRVEGEITFCLRSRPTLFADAIEVGAPDRSERPRFARVSGVEASVRPPSQLRGPPRIASLRIGRGEVVLEHVADGRASWQLPSKPGAPPDAPASVPVIERLEALDVGWRWIDPAGSTDLRGTLIVVDGRGRAGPDAAATGPRLEPATLGGLLGAVLPRTPPFRLEGRIAHLGERRTLAISKARIGESDPRGDVEFVAASDGAPARLRGRPDSTRMRIADLGRSVGFGEPHDRRGRGRRAAPRDAAPLTLRAPIDVAGTFCDPSVSIDRTRVAGTMLAPVVLGTLVAPIAALLPLLDFGAGDSACATRPRDATATRPKAVSTPPTAAPAGAPRP